MQSSRLRAQIPPRRQNEQRDVNFRRRTWCEMSLQGLYLMTAPLAARKSQSKPITYKTIKIKSNLIYFLMAKIVTMTTNFKKY